MKTFFADIIPKIQRFSQRLNDVTKLTNQHWVSIGDIKTNKTVYIFDSNGEIDIFENGVGIDSGTWKFSDEQSMKLKLTNNPPLLLKHGFFDENVIALKLDSTNNYAFFVNETRYDKELNNINDVLKFLNDKYLKNKPDNGTIGSQRSQNLNSKPTLVKHQTDKGTVEIPPCISFKGQPAYMNGRPAPDGKYSMGLFSSFTVKNGIIIKG